MILSALALIFIFKKEIMTPKNVPAFTLMEILVAIVVFSLIMLFSIQTLGSLGIWKIKLIQTSNLEKQIFFSGEKIFDIIKRSGTIDYEEYWNRYSYNRTFVNGAFSLPTWFGNFGDTWVVWTPNYGTGKYLCRSWNGTAMGTGWCLNQFNTSGINQRWKHQRYGQYAEQFIDYNSDRDSNLWDENLDGNIRGDEDDFYIWLGPNAFTGVFDSLDPHRVWELYLYNPILQERTFFRWFVGIDPDAPAWSTCTGTWVMTWDACLGSLEFLKLLWRDWGNDHDVATLDADATQSDGKIDTWIIHPDFLSNATPVVAGSNATNYWQSVLPWDIHVKNVEFYIYPRNDYTLAWRDIDNTSLSSPYLQIRLTLEPSWIKKRIIKWNIPEVEIFSTIQLLNLTSQ